MYLLNSLRKERMPDLIIIKSVAKKEIRQLSREKRMLFVIFLFPMFLLLVFGYAINLDVKHIQFAVLDYDRTKETRNVVNSLNSSEYFDLVGYVSNYKEAEYLLNSGKTQLVIVFPKDFEKKVYRFEGVKLQFLIDGVNGNASNVIYNYSNIVSNYIAKKFLENELPYHLKLENMNVVTLVPRFWYNPELKSNIFLIPGLIGIIIILTAAITVSLSIVKEKENNTLEQILLSPIRPLDFIVGKVLPYLFIALVNSFLVIFFGNLIFGVPLKGNILLLLIAILIYIYSSLSIGVFASVIASNQLLAFLLVVIISVLPSMLLSGFIFPIESMPFVVQLLTNLTPAKFFLTIIRGLLLKGINFDFLWKDYLYLLCYGSIFIFISFVAYQKNLKIE